MHPSSPDELSSAALRMRDAIERRLFAKPTRRRRRGTLPVLAVVALTLLACVLGLR